MGLKIALLLFVLTNSLVAAEDQPQTRGANEFPAGVEVRFEYGGYCQVKLLVKNTGYRPVSLNSNICDISQNQFMDFPTAAAIQLKASHDVSLEIKGEKADGWWYPNIINSTIPTPMFSQRGLKVEGLPDESLKSCVLPARGEKVMIINYRRVLNLAKAEFSGAGHQSIAESCRIGINIRVAVTGGVRSYFIFTKWFNIRDAE